MRPGHVLGRRLASGRPGPSSHGGSDGVGVDRFVVAGQGERARAAHHQRLQWLCRHHRALRRCTVRLAWIIEDQGIRACADAWLARAGGRLLDAETRTFARVRPAIAWLIDERRSEDERTPAPWVAAPARGGAWG